MEENLLETKVRKQEIELLKKSRRISELQEICETQKEVIENAYDYYVQALLEKVALADDLAKLGLENAKMQEIIANQKVAIELLTEELKNANGEIHKYEELITRFVDLANSDLLGA